MSIYLSPRQAEPFLGVSFTTIQRHCRSGKIPAQRGAGTTYWKIPLTWLMQQIDLDKAYYRDDILLTTTQAAQFLNCGGRRDAIIRYIKAGYLPAAIAPPQNRYYKIRLSDLLWLAQRDRNAVTIKQMATQLCLSANTVFWYIQHNQFDTHRINRHGRHTLSLREAKDFYEWYTNRPTATYPGIIARRTRL